MKKWLFNLVVLLMAVFFIDTVREEFSRPGPKEIL
jgi:hypothetical protein